ncbi:MAG: hypothetical protein JF616_07865 [Fibrobacteres bacterium]|nr:hypothetical protein [Fibrobacterota bacterium]
MNPNNRLSLAYGLALSTLLPLAFSGCQTVEPGPEASSSQKQYTAAVLKLKASAPADYDQELSKLNARFSGSSPAASVVNPAAPTAGAQAAAKVAGTLTFQTSYTATAVSKLVFKATAHAVATLRADVSNTGTFNSADPVVFLIQFNDQAFISNGTINNRGQQGFRIVDMNDDGGGGRNSYLSHTFSSNEVGYYMWLVLPYANSNVGGKVDLSFDLTNPGCPSCQAFYRFSNPTPLGGAVFRRVAGNDFQAMSDPGAGNTHLYVFKNTASSGMANGDASIGTINSRVFALPFGISPWESNDQFNMVLIDNDASGTTAQGPFYVYNE